MRFKFNDREFNTIKEVDEYIKTLKPEDIDIKPITNEDIEYAEKEIKFALDTLKDL